MRLAPRFALLALLGLVLAPPACGNDTTNGGAPVSASSPDAGASSDDASLGNNGDGAVGMGGREGGGSASISIGEQPDGAPCAKCARNWNLYPPVVEVTGASELWVLSDVHGDYHAFTKLLIAAKLIAGAPATPANVIWTGNTAYLVIVGDLIDKGPDAVDVVRLAAALQIAAKAAGGGVVVTMGNHEAEFLADPSNSKATSTDGIDPELNEAGLASTATAAGQDDVGAFLRNLPFAARVDDWFFVHAGKTHGRTIATLASDLQAGIDADGFGAPVLSAVDSLLEARLNDQAPQWWDATNDAVTLLTQWTAALGVKHLVMGHQPGAFAFADKSKRGADQMIQKYGALLFLIDTGLSVGADGTGGAMLHVQNPGAATESFDEVLPNGSKNAL